MNTTSQHTPEELLEAEESARLIDDVLAERNINQYAGTDLHTAHLLRTLHPDATMPNAAFLTQTHQDAQKLFPRQTSLFYRMRFGLIGLPLLGSMAVAIFVFTQATPENTQSSSIAQINQNTPIENNNTLSTINENANVGSKTSETTNTPVIASAEKIDAIIADLAALNTLEAEITTAVDDISGLLADSTALNSTDTVSDDIDSLSTELSTL